MAKVTLTATKTFYNNGTFIIAGDTFDVEEYQANAYIARNLAEKASAPTTETGENVALEDKTVSELRELAKQYGITGYSNMTKAELIQAIRAHEVEESGRTV